MKYHPSIRYACSITPYYSVLPYFMILYTYALFTTYINIPYIIHIFVFSCLAPFEINITARNIQQVGSSLTLDCSIKEIYGINSSLEIVWTTTNTILQRTNVMATVMGSSSVYTDSYTITQLTTSDHGRVIQCIANRTSPPVVDNGIITLNVIGKLKGSKINVKT